MLSCKNFQSPLQPYMDPSSLENISQFPLEVFGHGYQCWNRYRLSHLLWMCLVPKLKEWMKVFTYGTLSKSFMVKADIAHIFVQTISICPTADLNFLFFEHSSDCQYSLARFKNRKMFILNTTEHKKYWKNEKVLKRDYFEKGSFFSLPNLFLGLLRNSIHFVHQI